MRKINIVMKVLFILLLTITISIMVPKSGYCELQDESNNGRVADDVEKAKEQEKANRTKVTPQESRSTSEGKTYTGQSSETIDGFMNDGKDFIANGEQSSDINQGQLQKTSNILYNIFLGAGIIVAVLVGMFLGMKYMMGSVEEKADLKQTLVAYAVGCVVIFGAFGIWKLVAEVFSGV